jgi:single-stranded-DNA-specific exonuclease
MKKVLVRRQTPMSEMQLKIHPLLERIYRNRGIASLEELERGFERLHSFQLFNGIEKAVQRLFQAISQQERIIVVGDFDADGATSTALAVSALQSMGAQQVSYLVPNRFDYGYGLTPEIVDVAVAQRQPQLLITVDNGISSIAGVDHANAKKIDVIITDHHLPGNELPSAIAIVNPNLNDDQFPSKNLAGVGVIFYLMLALRSYLREKNWFQTHNLPEPHMGQFLDLVALGTVADVVHLDSNNRILVHQGIQRIRGGKARPGIQALLEVAGRSAHRLVSNDLGFAVAPRLNAAGRLDDMSLGIECLLSQDASRARDIAVQLDLLNKERQTIEMEMQQQALECLKKLQIENNPPLGVCLHDESWHQGVVGIVASRIKDRLHRPVIAFASVDENELKGSARSIQGVHIRDVLDAIATKYPGMIHKFGGHAMAAGLSIAKDQLQAFSQAFAAQISCHLGADDLEGKIHSDGELSAEDFTIAIAEMIRDAGPWGQGFPEPLFDNCFEVVEQRLVGTKHLKLMLQLPGSPRTVDAIAFNIDAEKWPNHRVNKIHAAYRLDINEFRGQRSVQAIIDYFQPIES